MFRHLSAGWMNHLLCSFALGAELATAPGKVLQEWASNGQPLTDQSFVYKGIRFKRP